MARRSLTGRGAPRRPPNLLDMTPVREVEWEEDEGGIVTLVRRRPAIRGPRSLARWISYLMAPPRIRLDDVGSYAWLRIDGGTDVRRLVALVREEFGDRVEPVSQRLGQLIRLLHRERFVRYRQS
ncbi:MAG: PqqD family protein [Gemmatimonadetes bacterium]|nr:PqqD family protein [Gemmatimonadota bacterium]